MIGARWMVIAAVPALAAIGLALSGNRMQPAPERSPDSSASAPAVENVMKTEEEWKKTLTADQFYVLRKKGTERAFSGKYHDAHDDAVYVCAACGQELFDSAHKFDSGTGWPSFYQPIQAESVGTEKDRSFFMVRTEVHCSRCGGHLGHVFEDGPKPTGLRYCINSVSLDQKKRPAK